MGKSDMNTPDEKLTEKEIDARREAGLKKLLAMPPKPHKTERDEAADRRARADTSGDSPGDKKF